MRVSALGFYGLNNEFVTRLGAILHVDLSVVDDDGRVLKSDREPVPRLVQSVKSQLAGDKTQ